MSANVMRFVPAIGLFTGAARSLSIGASLLAALATASVLLGCATAPPSAAQAPVGCESEPDFEGQPRGFSPSTLEQWRRARARLTELRRGLRGSGPHTMRLSVKLREPFTGRVMEARGAVALSPPDALRMILLGPGGTTALDLWVKEERFRFAVPAIDILRRGDGSTPRDHMRGLPVDFLRWWLLRPAAGTLLWYERTPRADRFVLRDKSAIVELCAADGDALTARRTTWISRPGGASDVASASERFIADVEAIVATSRGCGPVRYTQRSTGLEVEVQCEGEELERAPSPRAFSDPDAPGGIEP